MNDDKTLVSCVSPGSTTKNIATIAELLCDITRERGVTEMRMYQHAMSPKMKVSHLKFGIVFWIFPMKKLFDFCADGWHILLIYPNIRCNLQVAPDGQQLPLQYRYKVVADNRVDAFKPKEIPASDDVGNLRSAVMGAHFNGRLTTIPKASHCTIVWEVTSASWGMVSVLDLFHEKVVGKSFEKLVESTFFPSHSILFIPGPHSKKDSSFQTATCQVKVGEEAIVTPLKPKFYLLGTVTVKASEALKLKWLIESAGWSALGVVARMKYHHQFDMLLVTCFLSRYQQISIYLLWFKL